MGYYRYILEGDVDFYATVIYDPGSDAFDLRTYEEIYGIYFTLDYSEDSRFSYALPDSYAFHFDDEKMAQLKSELDEITGKTGEDENPGQEGDNGKQSGKSDDKDDDFSVLVRSRFDFQDISGNPSGSFKLVNDIDFGGAEINPIDSFSGVLDGDGKTISNFKIKTNSYYSGLFREVSGTIKNLKISGAEVVNDIQGSDSVAGILAGNLKESGSVTDCAILNSSISSSAHDWDNTEGSSRRATAGGLIGKSYGSITGCESEGCSILAYSRKHDTGWSSGYDEASIAMAGGLLGEFCGGTLTGCRLKSLGSDGLVGRSHYRIASSFDFHVHQNIYVGGIIGAKNGDGTINTNNCYVATSSMKAEVTGQNDNGFKPGYNGNDTRENDIRVNLLIGKDG